MQEEKAELKLVNSRLTKELNELKISHRQRQTQPLLNDDREQIQVSFMYTIPTIGYSQQPQVSYMYTIPIVCPVSSVG